MTETTIYKTEYDASYALVIGINNYVNASPLLYARNDAEAVAELLEQKFCFPSANITTLYDAAATGYSIRKAFSRYSNEDLMGPDDRLVVFFAGHGHTISGKRGEVGFLVPADGDPAEMASLIRWDEFTRNSDLLPAKHIFFIMDACYGGLALHRHPAFGSMRFLGDMLQRYARQVLAAGKPDEPVSDGNGVRPGHSLFTAHFLNALDGAVATKDGIITASGVMAYVYDRVGRDQYSKQTPHYGFIDGDGDFIFSPTSLRALKGPNSDQGDRSQSRGDEDVLINTSQEVIEMPPHEETISEVVKDLLSSPSSRIKLDDFVQRQVREFLATSDLRNFPVQGGETPEQFVDRVGRYEQAIKNLQHISILLAKWGEGQQLLLLERIFVRLAETDKGGSGLVIWLGLTWYPVLVLMYATGISALASKNYTALTITLKTKVQVDLDSGKGPQSLVSLVSKKLGGIEDAFKMLPGLEQRYVPRSEHLFRVLQPVLEDELLLGRSYETLFDQFEVLMALAFMDENNGGWAPVGRFGWKQSRGYGVSPLDQELSDAKKYGATWAPLVAGLFEDSSDGILKNAEMFKQRIAKLYW